MDLEDDTSSRSELALACSKEDYDRVRELLATGSDPVTSRSGYFSWSPLHYAAKQGRLDFARTLIAQYGCHAQVEDKEGRTPLHVACQYGQLEFARYLIQQKRCDASYLDVEDQTPLHHACGWLSECSEDKALEMCRYLVSKARCDPNARDVNGRSCMLHACEKGFVSVLKYFMDECGCSLEGFDYKGNNALHLAVSFSNQFDIVSFIVGRKAVDIEGRNNKGSNVLHMAAIANSSPEICRLILDHNRSGSLLQFSNEDEVTPLDLAGPQLRRMILSRFQIHREKFYDRFALELGVKQSPESACRVLVVGDPQSGKSTLIRSLMKESSSFSSSFSLSFSSSSPVSPVPDESRGVKTTHFESKSYGHVVFYDFSAHDSYTQINARILQKSFRPTHSVCIIVLDLRKPVQEVSLSLRRWLEFLSNAWPEQGLTSESSPAKVIVIGSHTDVGKSSSKTNRSVLKSISVSSLESVRGRFEIVARIAVEFHKSEYSGITALRKQMSVSCGKSGEESSQLSFNACCLLTYLNSKFTSQRIVTLQALLSDIELFSAGEGKVSDVRYFLSDDASILVRLLESLERAGHISLLLDEADMKQSLVIQAPHELYSELSMLWSSDRSSASLDHQQLVPISRLAGLFLDEDPHLIARAFSHLNLCGQVWLPNSSEHEELFYFPSLVSGPPPKHVWGVMSRYDHHFGWVAELAEPERKFPQRLVHTILQRTLAESTSATKGEDLALWSGGFYLKCSTDSSDGSFEVILDTSEDSKAIILLMRARKFSSQCLKYRSAIISTIHTCIKDKVTFTESLMDPFEAMKYPIPPRESLTLFSVSDVLLSLQSDKPTVLSKDQVEIECSRLYHCDPLAAIGSKCLNVLLNSRHDELVSEEFLKSMAESVTGQSGDCDLMLGMFSTLFASSQAIEERSIDQNGLYSLFTSWNSLGRTYTDVSHICRPFSLYYVMDT